MVIDNHLLEFLASYSTLSNTLADKIVFDNEDGANMRWQLRFICREFNDGWMTYYE